MTRSFLNITSQHALRALTAASLFALASAAHAAPPVPGFPSFAAIGDVSNYTNPGVWEHHGVDVAAAWFAGANDSSMTMFDARSGGGFDGLEINGVNHNEGAESTLAYISTMQRARSLVSAP